MTWLTAGTDAHALLVLLYYKARHDIMSILGEAPFGHDRVLYASVRPDSYCDIYFCVLTGSKCRLT